MNPALHGKVFRSEPFTHAQNSTWIPRLDFLAKARNMDAPEVAELYLAFQGTVDGVTATALGRDAAKQVLNWQIRDRGGELVNASGALLRVLAYAEYGTGYADPGDVASGATNSSYEFILPITYDPPKAHRGRDYRIRLEHFLEGGEVQVQTAAAVPTGVAAWSGTWRLYARVVDGRTRELKTRRRIREEVVSQQEYDYQVNGFLRYAILSSRLTTTGYTSLAASVIDDLFSRTLEFEPNLHPLNLRFRYRQIQALLGISAADECLLATPGAIPIVFPGMWQRIGQSIDTETLHLDLLASAPASARLLTDVIVDRDPTLAAMVAGYGNLGEYQAGMKAFGRIVDDKDNDQPVRSYDPRLARRLPIRFKV